MVPIDADEPPLLSTETVPPDNGPVAFASVTVRRTVGNVTSVPSFTFTPESVLVVPPSTTRKSYVPSASGALT